MTSLPAEENRSSPEELANRRFGLPTVDTISEAEMKASADGTMEDRNRRDTPT